MYNLIPIVNGDKIFVRIIYLFILFSYLGYASMFAVVFKTIFIINEITVNIIYMEGCESNVCTYQVALYVLSQKLKYILPQDYYFYITYSLEN